MPGQERAWESGWAVACALALSIACIIEVYLLCFCPPIAWGYNACYLASYYGNTIAIDRVGAVLPTFLSTLVPLALVTYTRRMTSNRRLVYYVLFTVVLGVGVAVEYVVAGWLYGGTLGVSKWWLLATYAGAFAAQRATFKSEHRVTSVLFLSISWTFAMILSDCLRIVGRTVNFSPQIIGAGGIYDAVFLGWLIASIVLAAATGYYAPDLVRKLISRRHRPVKTGQPHDPNHSPQGV